LEYAIIAGTTLLSCLLFERIHIIGVTNKLIASYRQQFSLMQNKDLGDEEKQQLLLAQVKLQLGQLLKLILLLVVFVSPFIVYTLAAPYTELFSASTLYRWEGILATFVGVGLYFILKRMYVKLFGQRKGAA